MADHTTAWERFDDWVKKVIELGGSDLHLVAGYKPMGRVGGELQPVDELLLTPEQTSWVAVSMFGNGVLGDMSYQSHMHKSQKFGDSIGDVTLTSAGGSKVIAVRLHGGKIPSLEKVNMPDCITELLSADAGILLVTGPHGSGKTTSLYSMVDWINHNRNLKICTVEHPRWFLFQPSVALVQQHEVGLDGPSAGALIASVLRQAPNVLMVGDIEDFESLAAVLAAAETGHLVVIQLHANNAEDAVRRLIDAAPEGMQEQVKRQLRETLRGVVNQRLARKVCPKCDGKGCDECEQVGYRGRLAVYEILGEGARKFVDGEQPKPGMYMAKSSDEIQKLEQAGTINKETAEQMRNEFGA